MPFTRLAGARGRFDVGMTSMNNAVPGYAPLSAVPAAVSAGLLAIAFSDGFALVAWFALVPLALQWRFGRPSVHAYLGAGLAGVVFHLVVFDWMRTRAGHAGLFGSAACSWLLAGVTCGLFWLPLIWFGFQLQRHRWAPTAVIVPIAWIVYEYTRKKLTLLIDETGFPW
jgi:hypothetical protein